VKLKLDLHDVHNRSGDIDRVEKDSVNVGRVFVHFRWK
jgi:hypothetical protein